MMPRLRTSSLIDPWFESMSPAVQHAPPPPSICSVLECSPIQFQATPLCLALYAKFRYPTQISQISRVWAALTTYSNLCSPSFLPFLFFSPLKTLLRMSAKSLQCYHLFTIFYSLGLISCVDIAEHYYSFLFYFAFLLRTGSTLSSPPEIDCLVVGVCRYYY